MARYVEIGTRLAQRVRSGELPAGTELPAVREYAHEVGATSSTIVRAYRYLADAAVITRADRRRARVATDGAIAAARLLESDRVSGLPAATTRHCRSCSTGSGPWWFQSAPGAAFKDCGRWPAGRPTVPRSTCATAAVPTTRHSPELYWATRIRTCCTCGAANRDCSSRPATLVASPALPISLVCWSPNGELGAGTRVLLDQLLIAEHIAPHEVAGPELHSHLEIALAVAAGIADIGLGLRAGVADLGLEFVPLTWESYDIALGGAALGAAQPTDHRTP